MEEEQSTAAFMAAVERVQESASQALTATGAASGSTNPLVDYHVIYALVLIALAATHAGNTWWLGRAWESRELVRRHAWLA